MPPSSPGSMSQLADLLLASASLGFVLGSQHHLRRPREASYPEQPAVHAATVVLSASRRLHDRRKFGEQTLEGLHGQRLLHVVPAKSLRFDATRRAAH